MAIPDRCYQFPSMGSIRDEQIELCITLTFGILDVIGFDGQYVSAARPITVSKIAKLLTVLAPSIVMITDTLQYLLGFPIEF